jgi:hypothetical protein
MSAARSNTPPLSEVVRTLVHADAQALSLGEVVDAFGTSALASLLLIFGLACSLPLPPGATTIFGLPILLLAPQLVLDQPAPWLPERLRRRRLAATEMRGVFERMIPWLKRMEAISRPRLGFVVGATGRRLIGVICTLFGLVLILPIPLGNMLPAATVSVFSLSLIQRDGVLAAAGYGIAAISVGALMLAANLIAAAARTLLTTLTLA